MNLGLDRLPPEQRGVIGSPIQQNFQHKWAQAAAKPIVGRDIESDLPAPENRGRQFIPHQFPEQNFLP
jgi:hypothetical protein